MGQIQMFSNVADATWAFRDVKPARMARLRQYQFTEIVDMIAQTATLVSFRMERGKPGLAYSGRRRPVVTVRVDPQVADLFQLQPRAARPVPSERENRTGRDPICREDLRQSDRGSAIASNKHARHIDAIMASLEHKYAKAWIYQGTWLRSYPRTEGRLMVALWSGSRMDARRRKLARWASYLPSEEGRIQFKGAWMYGASVLDDGATSLKQSTEIHDCGYS